MLPRTVRRGFVSSRYIRQHQTSVSRFSPSKYDQDKDSINTTSNEYSKSAGDGQAAAEDTAFDPSKTSPESQHESARQESGSNSDNPLNVSPANHDISHTNADKQQHQPQGSKDETGGGSSRSRTSGGGSPAKSGGGSSGGGTSG
ncbi:hypothetical protein Slin15195_G006960 [Septoria linicola]|uniref:Uncharacterized protein n=1 Tax=Septoria linicola TaxID=215465 RepID=A0A9Q9AE93_9PEZI|nr:hypothetical protein Slin14017_G006970 [Septoria linicola]USW47377.1 hypothetical protein Slin15195_G006960 [Septoria linicola]